MRAGDLAASGSTCHVHLSKQALMTDVPLTCAKIVTLQNRRRCKARVGFTGRRGEGKTHRTKTVQHVEAELDTTTGSAGGRGGSFAANVKSCLRCQCRLCFPSKIKKGSPLRLASAVSVLFSSALSSADHGSVVSASRARLELASDTDC